MLKLSLPGEFMFNLVVWL